MTMRFADPVEKASKCDCEMTFITSTALPEGDAWPRVGGRGVEIRDDGPLEPLTVAGLTKSATTMFEQHVM